MICLKKTFVLSAQGQTNLSTKLCSIVQIMHFTVHCRSGILQFIHIEETVKLVLITGEHVTAKQY